MAHQKGSKMYASYYLYLELGPKELAHDKGCTMYTSINLKEIIYNKGCTLYASID